MAYLNDRCVYECVLRLEGTEKLPAIYDEFRPMELASMRRKLLDDIHSGCTIAINFVPTEEVESIQDFFEMQDINVVTEKQTLVALATSCYILTNNLCVSQHVNFNFHQILAVSIDFTLNVYRYCLQNCRQYSRRQIKKALKAAHVL